MSNILRTGLEKLLTVPIIKLARVRPWRPFIAVARAVNGMQLNAAQLQLIMKIIEQKTPCKLLVFGLGNDTVFWSLVNQTGSTLFLEDNQFWIDRITERSPEITACLVEYKTRRGDWKSFLGSPSLLELSLPEAVKAGEWDVIVVDGPAGYDDNTPGRMMSIYTAAKLARKGTDVFVHDCDREIEATYCDMFLKPENLSSEIKSSHGDLRHYCMTTR